MLNVLYGPEVGPLLVRDRRVDFITFTGSSKVGADIKAASGLRRVALELGGAGQTIVHRDAVIEEAAPLCARNGMRLAGQSCISVQTIYAHRDIYQGFVDKLVETARSMKTGDPLDPATDVGTLIDEVAARRVESWVNEAVSSGARILIGGTRHGAGLCADRIDRREARNEGGLQRGLRSGDQRDPPMTTSMPSARPSAQVRSACNAASLQNPSILPFALSVRFAPAALSSRQLNLAHRSIGIWWREGQRHRT